MSFFDKLKILFKKPKKPVVKPKKLGKKPPAEPKKLVQKPRKPEKPTPKPIKKPKIIKKVPAELSGVILAPQITEKTTDLSAKNKYVFKVSSRANKSQIKRAIRALYGVKVIRVNVVNIHRKARKIGRTSGFKSGYKKAIVTLVPGQKIEVVKGV